jgi:diaminopimelate decarboxylase
VQAPVALRVNPDVDPKTHAKISTGMSENKFGIAFDQVRDAYAHAATLPYLQVQGISMHIGSQLTDLTPFRQAFRAMLSMVEQLRADGHTIQTLDLGGGLGIPYGDSPTPPPDPLAYAEAVKAEIPHFDGTLLFEPGRMIAGNAGILVTKVIATKQGGSQHFLIVDAGMNDLMRPAMYDAFHEVVSCQLSVVSGEKEARSADRASAPDNSGNYAGERKLERSGGEQSIQKSSCRWHANVNRWTAARRGRTFEGPLKNYTIVGPVCESSDVFGKDRLLPPTQAGDLLAFRTCGAYGASMSNRYNARPLVPEVLVDGENWAITRPRESYQQIVGSYRLPDWLE